jgi:ribosomal protein S18 acetylase RimI-like enzyme
MGNMKIINSTISDIESTFKLYEIATSFQKKKFPGNQWPIFSRTLVETEIKENRQWKLLINGQIACIWAITFSDPQIWEDSNDDLAIYIHRIATNPNYRGQNLVSNIVEWAKKYSADKQISFIRMDTCGHNKRLISHYEKCGFTFLGISKLKNSEGLPSHYHDADVCFFEIML